MLRQSDIAAAFREAVLRNPKGYQYLHTKDFVSALRRRGIHLSEVEANSWIAREKRISSIARWITAKTDCG
ncbi:Uncharacterised protein [Klebsiella pneumoniae]|nr:Uncharacterised protein [Klebsiella pneumoniae]